MSRKKKWAAALFVCLTLAMSAGTVSLAAKNVAKIGNKGYATLQAAVDAVQKGQVIKVTGNITTKDTLNISKSAQNSFTIDFGSGSYKYKGSGYAIELKQGRVTLKNANLTAGKLIKTEKGTNLVIPNGTYKGIMLTNWGTTLIKSGTFKGTGSTEGDQVREVGLLDNYGTMTIKGGTFSAGKNTAIENRGTITISDGTFTSSLKAASGTPMVGLLLDNRGKQGGALADEGATATITGGTFTGNVTAVHNCGILTVKAGRFTSNKSCTIINAEGTITVSGGSFKSKAKGIHAFWTQVTAKTFISGGEVTSAGTAIDCLDGGIVKATGGTFTSTSSEEPVLQAIGEGSELLVTGGKIVGKETYAYYEEDGGKVTIGSKVKVNTKY